MKNLLLAILCCATLCARAQYEEERFPLQENEMAIIRQHKIASLVKVATTNGQNTVITTRYNKNGNLLYSHQKSSSEKVFHYNYDKQNRLIEIVDSSYDVVFKKWWTNTTTFTYHKNGLLKERTLNGYNAHFDFDAKQNKLSRAKMREDEDEAAFEYYFNTNHHLIKVIEKDVNETKTTTYLYDNQNREIKKVVCSNYGSSYDSLVSTTVYNDSGTIAQKTLTITRATQMLDDEGEALEGPLEIDRENIVTQYAYFDKKRLQNVITSKNNLPYSQLTHSYTFNNGTEIEQVTQTIGGKTTLEVTLVYDAAGLKTQVTETQHNKEKTTVTNSTFVYTFYR